jgi:hypothetical protein
VDDWRFLGICEGAGIVAVPPGAVPVEVVFAVLGVVLSLDAEPPVLPAAPAVVPVEVVFAVAALAPAVLAASPIKLAEAPALRRRASRRP